MESSLSEKEHQHLLDAIKDHAIFMMDVDGNIASWNEGAKRLKGYEEEEVIGKHFRMLFLPEDQESGRPECEMNDAIEKGKHEEDWWRVRKDGSRFWAHVILQPIMDDNNKHIGFAKITSDITDYKRIDELNHFLMNETAGYAIFLLDNDGKIVEWSKAAESIIGYTKKEIEGKSLSVLYVNKENENVRNRVEQHLSKAKTDRFEEDNWKVKKDGSIFWANYIITPLHNENGFVVMIRDLTDKRNYEQEIKTNSALMASNTQLEHFASITSHELREPVRKISTFCHKLKPESPEQEILINKILSSSKRLSTLLDDILELSLLTPGRVTVKKDLNTTIRNVIDSFEEEIQNTNAVINYKPLDGKPVVPGQIEQVMENLLSNALKFCCAGNNLPVINIESDIVVKENLEAELLETMIHTEHYLLIKVSDNGIGFDQTQSSKIFGLFSRLHRSTEFEGTGVGLSICRRIIDNRGGNITAYSEKGKGTSFVITLPYDDVQ